MERPSASFSPFRGHRTATIFSVALESYGIRAGGQVCLEAFQGILGHVPSAGNTKRGKSKKYPRRRKLGPIQAPKEI